MGKIATLSPRELHLPLSCLPLLPLHLFSLVLRSLITLFLPALITVNLRTHRAKPVFGTNPFVPGYFLHFCWGSGSRRIVSVHGLSSTADSPVTRGWSRTGIAPDVKAPVVAPCGAPVALPSTEDALGAVPKIAIIATAVVVCFGTISSLKSYNNIFISINISFFPATDS